MLPNSSGAGANPVVLAPTAVKNPQPTLQVAVLAEPTDSASRLLAHNLNNVVALLQVGDRFEKTETGDSGTILGASCCAVLRTVIEHDMDTNILPALISTFSSRLYF